MQSLYCSYLYVYSPEIIYLSLSNLFLEHFTYKKKTDYLYSIYNIIGKVAFVSFATLYICPANRSIFIQV